MEADNTKLVDALQRAQQRVREARRAQCSGPGCAESRAGMPFGRGQRVLDTVTGQEGIIDAGKTANTVVQLARG